MHRKLQLETSIDGNVIWGGGTVGWGTAPQVGRSRVQFPMVSLEFFISGRTVSLGSPQPLTKMSTRGGGGVKAAGA